MKVVPIRVPEKSANSPHLDLLEGVETKKHSPLIQHLAKIAEQADIQRVIQLLHDIRLHQDHPDMIRAFNENSHELAHEAKDHEKNVLELLVEDYLEHNQIDTVTDVNDQHRRELEMHVKHTALSTLKGYQEVVEGIRLDVTGLAEALEADESIHHLRSYVRSIHGLKAHDSFQESINDLPSAATKEVFRGESEDMHTALAKAAFSKGHRSHETASEYLKEELYAEMREHFEDALQAARRTPRTTSGIYVSDLVIENITRNRQSNPRINAAFSLMEGLKRKLGKDSEAKLKGLLGDNPKLPETVIATLQDDTDEGIENVLAEQTDSIGLDLVELDLRVETLTDLYIRSVCEHDYKIRRGITKIEQYRGAGHRLKKEMEEVVPDGNHELLEVMQSQSDIVDSVVRLWLKEDFGNIESLDRLLDRITTDAQCYLDTERPTEIPYSQPDVPEERLVDEKMLKKVRYPSFGSAAYNLLQVFRASKAISNNQGPLADELNSNTALQEMLARFTDSEGVQADSIFDQYLDLKDRGDVSVSFDDYLESLLKNVQDSCNSETYQKLLRWSARKTIPAAPAPPSLPRYT